MHLKTRAAENLPVFLLQCWSASCISGFCYVMIISSAKFIEITGDDVLPAPPGLPSPPALLLCKWCYITIIAKRFKAHVSRPARPRRCFHSARVWRAVLGITAGRHTAGSVLRRGRPGWLKPLVWVHCGWARPLRLDRYTNTDVYHFCSWMSFWLYLYFIIS